MDELLTTKEAAKLIGQHPVTLGRWRQSGGGPKFIKRGRYIRYKRSDVEAWLTSEAA